MNYYSVSFQLKLEKMLEELHSKIGESIFGINSGGCGWFALYLHQTLKKSGIHTDILALDNDNVDVEKKNSLIKQLKNKELKRCRTRLVACHYMVHVTDEFVIDGDSCVCTDDVDLSQYENVGQIPVDNLSYLLENESWNSYYDVSQNLILKSIINSTVKKYFPVTNHKQIA